jgi:uncharacterized protein (TIGR03000 family)
VIPVPPANSEIDALRKENERLRKQLEQKKPKPGNEEGISTPISSRVTVTLPSDARLWVDNVECPLTSAIRSFDTPALDPARQYVYDLKVQFIRDGQTVTNTQRAVIVPGREVRVDFNGAATGTASR